MTRGDLYFGPAYRNAHQPQANAGDFLGHRGSDQKPGVASSAASWRKRSLCSRGTGDLWCKTRGRQDIMGDRPGATLVRLDDTDLVVADPAEDVRGTKVLDSNGDHIGDVDSIVIDEEEKKVRFLEVGSGGFLGIGEQKRLVPVDAVTAVDDVVRIDQKRDTVAASAAFDPELVPAREYYDELYRHYGYTPFWAPGYVYPPFPIR